MTKPIIGNNAQECINCGKRYGDSKAKCPYCGEPNPDYISKSERFNHKVGRIEVVEGIWVKRYEDDIET